MKRVFGSLDRYPPRFSRDDGCSTLGRRSRGAQGFCKFFQRIAWICQVFPKIPLAVLCDFNGLQGKKGNKIIVQIFRSEAAPKRVICFLTFGR
jgi:hypothetical protein